MTDTATRGRRIRLLCGYEIVLRLDAVKAEIAAAKRKGLRAPEATREAARLRREMRRRERMEVTL